MRKTIAIAAFLTLGSLSAVAQDSISFGYAPTFSNTGQPFGTIITNQFPDVTFSLSGGTLGSQSPATDFTGLSNSPNPGPGSFTTSEDLVATFATPVSDVSLNFWDISDNYSYSGGLEPFGGGEYYAVYGLVDGVNELLAVSSLPQASPTTYTLTGLDYITSIVWDNGTGGLTDANFDLDSINYTLTPPPVVPEGGATLGYLTMAGLVCGAAFYVASRNKTGITPAA